MKHFQFFDLDIQASTDKPGEVYLRIIDKDGKLGVLAAMYDDTLVDAVMRFLEQSGKEPQDTVGQWTTAPGEYDVTVCFRSAALAQAWLAQL